VQQQSIRSLDNVDLGVYLNVCACVSSKLVKLFSETGGDLPFPTALAIDSYKSLYYRIGRVSAGFAMSQRCLRFPVGPFTYFRPKTQVKETSKHKIPSVSNVHSTLVECSGKQCVPQWRMMIFVRKLLQSFF